MRRQTCPATHHRRSTIEFYETDTMDVEQAEELAKTLSQMKQILQGTQGMPSLRPVVPHLLYNPPIAAAVD